MKALRAVVAGVVVTGCLAATASTGTAEAPAPAANGGACLRGYVLDGFGGLHPFRAAGSPAAPPIAVGAYTPGNDIWVQLVGAVDGTASGRMTSRTGTAVYHAAGVPAPTLRAPEAVPPPARRIYFSNPSGPIDEAVPGTVATLYGHGEWSVFVDGNDRSRDYSPRFASEVARAWNQGLLLDGLGGLHPVGIPGIARVGPASTAGGPYWPGWDIARGIAVLPHNAGGYVLDGFGGLHPFSIAGKPMPPRIASGPYWSGWDIARDVVLIGCPA